MNPSPTPPYRWTAAVARFRGARLVHLLYAGDDLSGETWDGRSWRTRHEVRDNMLDLAITTALRIDKGPARLATRGHHA